MVILFVVQIGTAQQFAMRDSTKWSVSIAAGYVDAFPNDVRMIFDGTISKYRAAGIPIAAQTPFSNTVYGSFGFLISRRENLWTGLSVGYYYTPAFAKYKDYSGTLDINGKIHTVDLSLVLKAIVWQYQDIPLFFTVQPGISRGTSAVKEELRFYSMPQFDRRWEWNTVSWGYTMQMMVGSMTTMGGISISLDGGYRFVWNKSDEETTVSNEGKDHFYLPLSIGQKGMVMMITMGYPL